MTEAGLLPKRNRITQAVAREILALAPAMKQLDLARRFGVSVGTINAVLQGQRQVTQGMTVPGKVGQGENSVRHGNARHGHESPTYRSWQAMLARCRYPDRDKAKKHVGRGITVCERWNESFDVFLADMGVRPAGTTIDRIDNDGNYELGNCRWATPREQSRNRRNARLTLEKATEVAVARLRGEICRTIAERFDISESLPREIVKGRTWPDALARAQQIVGGENV